MPEYRVRDPQSGRTVVLRGDSPPTEQELEEVFRTLGASSSAPAPVNPARLGLTPTPAGRTLAPAEARAIRERVKAEVPEGSNYFASALEGALAEAQASPEPISAGEGRLETVKGFLSTFNPAGLITMARENWDPALDGMSNAIKLAGKIAFAGGRASWDQIQQANALAAEGRDWEAGGHAIAAAVPFIGPAAAHAAEAIGSGDPRRTARGVGEATGLIVQTLAPGSIAQKGEIGVLPKIRSSNAAEAAAVDWMLEQGIPVDVATATGNPAIRGVQFLADRSTIPGAAVARKAERATAVELERVGRGLAEQAAPGSGRRTAYEAGEAVGDALTKATGAEAGRLEAQGRAAAQQITPSGRQTPYASAEATQGALADLIRSFKAEADQHYDALRAAEAAPEHQSLVPKPQTAAERAAAARQAASVRAKQVDSLGGTEPTAAELQELRRIQVELDSLPYVKRTWTEAPKKSGNAAGGDYDITAGAAGASVFDDIVAGMDRTTIPNRSEVLNAVTRALETGHYGPAAKAALEVAQGRLRGGRGLSRAELPPEAGLVRPALEEMGLAIDLKRAREPLRPIYEDLLRQSQITPASLVGGKARALQALDRLFRAPDHAPLSIVDAALSDLKALARTDSLPELRTAGQGAAAEAVRVLDRAVVDRAIQAGPEVVDALRFGRAAHRAKVEAGELFTGLPEEPVGLFRQLTAPGDARIRQLEAVREHAPGSMDNLGRAWFESRLERAGANGPAVPTPQLAREWTALGERTKGILFSPEAQRAIDQFVRAETPIAQLAKRFQNPGDVVTRLTTAGGEKALRQLQATAPEVVPTVGRAWLDELMTKATAEGSFDRADLLAREWQNLPAGAKEVLFPQAAHRAALEHFFLGVKRLKFNPNPSGSALVGATGVTSLAPWLVNMPAVVGYQLSGYVLSKLLHSPRGARILTQGLTIPRASAAGPALAAQAAKVLGEAEGGAAAVVR